MTPEHHEPRSIPSFLAASSTSARDPIVTAVEARALPSTLRHGLTLKNFSIAGERLLPVVRVRTDHADGFGEAPPLPTFTGYGAGETIAGVNEFAARIVGRTTSAALDLIHHPSTGLGTPVRCALDVALHDATARARGVPLDALLGSRTQPSVRITRAIGFHDLNATLELVREYRSQGIDALKLKVGRGVAVDAELVLAVRAAAGPEIELTIDANEAYGAAEAVELARACRTADLAYFEQPVPRHDLAAMRAVRDAGLAVMADESAFGADDVERLARAGAADLIAIKLIKSGGLRPALEIARLARRHRLALTVIDPLGSAVSLNAGLALAITHGDRSFAHGLSAGLDVTTTYAPHLPLENGRLRPSPMPGLGIDVRWLGAEPAALTSAPEKRAATASAGKDAP